MWCGGVGWGFRTFTSANTHIKLLRQQFGGAQATQLTFHKRTHAQKQAQGSFHWHRLNHQRIGTVSVPIGLSAPPKPTDLLLRPFPSAVATPGPRREELAHLGGAGLGTRVARNSRRVVPLPSGFLRKRDISARCSGLGGRGGEGTARPECVSGVLVQFVLPKPSKFPSVSLLVATLLRKQRTRFHVPLRVRVPRPDPPARLAGR